MAPTIAIGHHHEVRQPDFIRAVAAEVILTFLFVFAGVGSAMAAGKVAGGDGTIMGLTAVAVAHALVVAVMISAGLHISGGHLNPAVTLGLAVGGHITLFRSAVYILAQLNGAVIACFLLKFLTGGLHFRCETPPFKFAERPRRGQLKKSVQTPFRGTSASQPANKTVVSTFRRFGAASTVLSSMRGRTRNSICCGSVWGGCSCLKKLLCGSCTRKLYCS